MPSGPGSDSIPVGHGSESTIIPVEPGSHESTSMLAVGPESESSSISVVRPGGESASSTPAGPGSESIIDALICRSRGLTDSEKFELLTIPQPQLRDAELDTRYFEIKGSRKRKQITFQRQWLKDYNWLRYSSRQTHRGGWCVLCCLFLSAAEQEHLGAFVSSPFVNYNKSNEICKKHASKNYHASATKCALFFKSSYTNPSARVDSSLLDAGAKKFKINCEILPPIIESVITCSRQGIALQGHKQDKIDFSSPPSANEGNFMAIIRLLAKYNPVLKDHLVSGARNARYTSKTIQNEIIAVAADCVRSIYKDCISNCPHFSVMADEVSSHGKEILSVCLRFLEIDHENYQHKPKKHEVLLDFGFLQRITGKHIAETVLSLLAKHNIDIANCRGQSYDTTASMSSSAVGVQAFIKKSAPDSDYQGCCLYSLNLVVCKASQISAVRNMMDSCQQAYLYFHNSNKRQRFLEVIIKKFSPSSKKVKIHGLCKTRWVERHHTFSTILELYPYLVHAWDEICNPTIEDEEVGDWKWDADSRSSANGLRHVFTNFEHIVAFMITKELLEPIKPIAECLQGRLQEVYLGFKKVDEVNKYYQMVRINVDSEHDRIYSQAKKLASDVDSEEKMPRVHGGRQTRSNPAVECPAQFWKVTITIPFLDTIISEMAERFDVNKRAHYELCSLIPEVIKSKENLQETSDILLIKWEHLLPSGDNFQSELSRWKDHCMQISGDKSITSLLSEDADPIFYPNVRELLCILAILPLGSTEAERSFSCLRRIHSWLRSTMSDERLGNLGVLALHGFDFVLDVDTVCTSFKRKNHRRMSKSLLIDSDV